MVPEKKVSWLEKLQAAARREDWAFVDENIGNGHTDEGNTWALGPGLDDANPNLRDLAATILCGYAFPFDAKTRQKMYRLMETDTNVFVRYRLAFALVVGGDRSELVRKTIEQARQDKEIGKIAEEYWNRYLKQ